MDALQESAVHVLGEQGSHEYYTVSVLFSDQDFQRQTFENLLNKVRGKQLTQYQLADALQKITPEGVIMRVNGTGPTCSNLIVEFSGK